MLRPSGLRLRRRSEGADVRNRPPVFRRGRAPVGLFPAGILKRIPSWEIDELRLADLAGTALTKVAPGATLEWLESSNPTGNRSWGCTIATTRRSGPPIGSRDTPRRVWFPSRSSELRVTDAAWVLRRATRGARGSVSRYSPRSLFPSNPLKRESAERAFQTFAVGSIPRKPSADGPIKAGGPFVWKISQLIWEDGTLMIGLTSSGRESPGAPLGGLARDSPQRTACAGLS